MKKLIVVGLLSVFLVACGEKDENYYFEHQDKAREKINSCEEQMMKAFMNLDEKAGRAIEADNECKAAKAAIKKQRNIEYEKEKAEKEQQKRLAEEARLKAITDIETQLEKELSGKEWPAVISEYLKQAECQQRFFNQDEDLNCVAWKVIYDKAVETGKTDLAQYSFIDLNAQEPVYCGLDKRRGSACTVWAEARVARAEIDLKPLDIEALSTVREDYCTNGDYNTCNVWTKAWQVKNDVIVKQFVEDDELFVETYNNCFAEVTKIRQADLKWNERSRQEEAIVSSYPCDQARQAYRNRGMGVATYKQAIAR
ncbi:hypothetical protein DC083_06325 [Ignatzschineria ureiclastica]|uniref:Lipoprotein n=1 Tax=Ignatzschineria ureiclastica TaxID=472582 RepID=A0A2U2ADI9_9GAMM|nr:hypothetical protein [Ignatzschineria ureiclastica]PWD80726.1 hypothetical protein DC083_06325 [Ignatzschineria ureiclastica]